MVLKSAVIRAFSAFTALALAAFAVGCGGETAAPLTKPQFIKQADAICARSDQRFQARYQYFMQHTPNPTLPAERSMAQWIEIVKTVYGPSIEQEVEELRALAPPRGDQRRVNAILAAIEEGLGKVREDPTVEAQTEAQFKKAVELAREYGLTVCGI